MHSLTHCGTTRCCATQTALAESKRSADTALARFSEEHASAVANLSRYEEVRTLQLIVAAADKKKLIVNSQASWTLLSK